MEPLAWFVRGLDAVWLRQPQRLRIPVSRPLRVDVRTAIRQANGVLRDATDGDRERRALRLLLATVAVATPTAPEGAVGETVNADAVRRGAARVAATLSDPLLRKTLADAGEREQPALLDLSQRRRLRALCAWTETLLDARSEREMRVYRRLRWAALAVAALVAVRAIVSDKNLARGQAVSASSICPSTPEPLPGRDRLSRLVDGDTVERAIPGQEWSHGTYAACTKTEKHPWITVDLGAEHTINKVVVFNRADCCWDLDDTPLSIQLSSDDRSFETVATRYNPFSDDFPWQRTIEHRRARYVRLYNPSESPKNIVLGEIEIYGQ
ncbi:MAG TPA: discoidin domain-containing protein [Polyangia bacterium]|jgi:hypothetical protein